MTEQTIVFGNAIYDVKTGKEINARVQSFHIDNSNKMVRISYEKEGRTMVQQINVSLEALEKMGVINWNALSPLIK